MKYYFEKNDSERCYSRQYFIEEMKEQGISEMVVYPAKMLTGELVAWCSIWGDAVETQRGDCGKDCDKYEPRNGKNGRCRYSNNCYEPEDKPITLKIKRH